LQVVDRAFGELTRLLDLAHGRVKVAERVEADETEQAVVPLLLLLRAATELERSEVGKSNLCHRTRGRILGAPTLDRRQNFL